MKERVEIERTGWWLFGSAVHLGNAILFAAAALIGHQTGRGLIIGPILAILTVPLMRWARANEKTFDLAGIVYAGLAVKQTATLGRFEMVDRLYNGVGDSTLYHFYGQQFAPRLRQFDFAIDPGLPIPGTGFIRVLTGAVYAVFGTDRFGGFLLFGFVGYLGAWFFYRAFALAAPDGNLKRYAILIFFWPSLTFWPSAIGKEAWMIFALGLTSWGAAAMYRRQSSGFALIALGVTAAAMPRPHIAIVVLVAVATGLVIGSIFTSGDQARSIGFITKFAGAIFLLIAGALLAPRVATFLNIDDVGGSGFAETRDEVIRRTSQGGSEFKPATINSLLDYPWAFITVLLRPFPYEARNAATLVSATEGMLLLGLFTLSIRQLLRLPVSLVKNPYVAYAASFAFMFCYVFAFIGNFGILARQRSQVLPFVFVLIAMPLANKGIEKAKQVKPPSTTSDQEPQQVVPRAQALAPPRQRA